MATGVSLHTATDDQVQMATRCSGGLWLAATVVMRRLERAMHAAGGPGIIAFELAGTERRATDIIDSWGLLAAVLSNWASSLVPERLSLS
jgi:hypothetical protein